MSCRLLEGRVATASESLRERRDDILRAKDDVLRAKDDVLRAIEEHKSKKITRRSGGLLFKEMY